MKGIHSIKTMLCKHEDAVCVPGGIAQLSSLLGLPGDAVYTGR